MIQSAPLQAFQAQLLALNALFDAARADEPARESARFVAFCADVSAELAQMQWQEVLDAICNDAVSPRTSRVLDDLALTVDTLNH